MRLGNINQAILIAGFLVFEASSAGQTGSVHRFHLDGSMQKDDVRINDRSIIINYSVPELNAESITNTSGTFYRITIPGHIHSAVPGKPEVPVFCRLITIPPGEEPVIKISDVRTVRIKPAGKKIKGQLFPAQESEIKEPQQAEPVFKIDKAAYATRGIIASDTVRIEYLGTVRNNRLANLYIYPVRYNPHSNTLDVIESMKVEITFSATAGISSKTLASQPLQFSQTLDKGLLNYNPGEVIPGFSEQPVKMIILTDSAFKKQLKPFIKWKTQKGFKVQTIYKGVNLAGDDYSHIKSTLANIYNSGTAADPPPEYLLIIGDVNRVPYYGTGGSGNITDMYYGEFDGNGDYIPEMFIGRLPVADTNELKSVVDKIIQYEKFQFADTNKFFSRALVSAGYDAGYSTYMNNQVKYAVNNYLTPGNSIAESHFNYPESYTAKDSIIKIINKGTSFINYTGHGEALGWLHLNIKTSDILTFQNKNMYPFVISNACRTAQFNLPTTFGCRMLLTNQKGAIGFIGCSNDSYWDEDYYWAVGPGAITSDPTYEGSGLGAYDRLFHTHGESPSDWYFTMGQINYAGNLAVSASTSPRKQYYWETYNLIGDPTITPILGTPGKFNIILPDTLPNGIKSVSMNVDPFSYVAVSHFDTLWDASFVSTSGTVVLNMPGVSDDSCLVVITGQNKVPVMKTIYFSNIHNEYINLTATSINDSLGNNNNIADYGEAVYLKLTLSNLGLTDSHNLYAKISSSSEWLTITGDSASLGTLPARTDIVISNKLGMIISDNVPDMGVATINLTLKDSVSEKHYSIDICMHAPELQIVNCVMDDKTEGDGNNIPDPGESFNLIFKVQNFGSSNISGQFDISSETNDLTIAEPNVKSGVLKFGQTTDIPVLVKLSGSVPSGSLISVTAILDCGPYVITRDFSFRVGKIRESFEASSFGVFPWINNSAVPWTITPASSYDGSLSAKSGAIGPSASTSLSIRTIYAKDDSVRFYYKVSSEPNYDYLSFKLNGTEVFKQSGEIQWTGKTIPIPAGLNKLEWTYKKDNSVSQGSDCAWIDMIDFAQTCPVSYIQKDLQVARILTPAKNRQLGMLDISVRLLNVGKDTLNGFFLGYDVNKQYPPVLQFFDNQLVPDGDTVTVTFKTKADLSRYGIYNIEAYGSGNNDDYKMNDTAYVSIENTNLDQALSVFPNPFSDKFTIAINSQTDNRLRISLTNLEGIRLYDIEKDILSGNNSFTIDDLSLVPSVYFLRIQGTGIDRTIKILKVRK